MSLGARPPFYWYICLIVHVGRKLIRYHEQVQRLIGKCFIGHTSSHLYLIVTQTLYMCFIVHFKPAMLYIMSSYTLWHLYWKNFPSWTLESEVWLETKQLLSIRSLCYQNQINIPGELCFLNRETKPSSVLHQFTVNNKIHLPNLIQSNLNPDNIQNSFLRVPF